MFILPTKDTMETLKLFWKVYKKLNNLVKKEEIYCAVQEGTDEFVGDHFQM